MSFLELLASTLTPLNGALPFSFLWCELTSAPSGIGPHLYRRRIKAGFALLAKFFPSGGISPGDRLVDRFQPARSFRVRGSFVWSKFGLENCVSKTLMCSFE